MRCLCCRTEKAEAAAEAKPIAHQEEGGGEANGHALTAPPLQQIPETHAVPQVFKVTKRRKPAAEPPPPPKPPEEVQPGPVPEAELEPELELELEPEDEAVPETDISVFALDLEEVKEATAGFDSDMYLGEGASGRFFQGHLASGGPVAVKVLKLTQQTEEEFLKHVMRLSRLQHENVVALKGFCVEGDTHMLLYELAPYGSLFDVLHGWREVKGGKPGPVLHWQQRIRIAMGAARGLQYLHEHAPAASPHRGMKSSNILLFEDSLAKLGDFNLTRESTDPAAPFDPEHEFSKQHLPEKVQGQKADIYGLGVVLLELLTGRKPVDTSAPHNQQSLVTWAMPRLSADKVKGIVDPRLKGRYPPEGPMRLGMVAALCMDDVDFRPPMALVIDALHPLTTMAMAPRTSSSSKSGQLTF